MTPERRLLWLVAIGIILIAAMLIGVVLTQLERRTIQIEVGASGEALRNPLLAAERFLARLAIPVTSDSGRERLRRLPPAGDVLVVRHLGALANDRRRALDRWIRDGGRLVVTAQEVRGGLTGAGEVGDDLIADYGVRLRVMETDWLAAGQPPDVPAEVIAEIPVEDPGRPLRVAYSGRASLETIPGLALDGSISLDKQLLIVHLSLGEGFLTVLADDDFMTNATIGQHDHALFTAQLLTPSPGGRVWLLYDREMPWLGSLIWSAAPLAVISGVLCLMVWGWSMGARLGPLETVPSRGRRDLMEHLDASGDFLWRQGAIEHLLAPTRRRVRALWQAPDHAHRQAPNHEDSSADSRADGAESTQALILAIAAAADESPDAVAAALFAQPPDTSAFVQNSALLQRLWRKGHGQPARHRERDPSETLS